MKNICSFFKSLLKQYGVKPKTVLDLACGTGSLSVLLAKSGYAVLGVDRSEDMLTVAAEKAMELEENQPFFVAQPMQRLRLPRRSMPVCARSTASTMLQSRRMCRKHSAAFMKAFVRAGFLCSISIRPISSKASTGRCFSTRRKTATASGGRFMIGA